MRVASGFVDHFPMVAFASTKLPKRPSVLYVQITKNWQTRGKELAKRSSKLKQLTFLRVSRVLERCTANLKASNAWAEMWNKKVEEKAGVKSPSRCRIPKFQKKEHAQSVEGVFQVSDSTASPYLKLADPTRTNQIV